MTKGKNKRLRRRKLRVANKNVNVDVGSKQSHRHIAWGYKSVAHTANFAKREDD